MKNMLSTNNDHDAKSFLNKVIIIYFTIILIIFVSFTVLFIQYNYDFLKYSLYVYIVQHLVWFFGFWYYNKIMPIDPLIKMYLSYMIVSLFPIICIFWNSGGHPTAFFWYMLIILGAIVFQIEKIGLWSTIILIMVAAAIFLGEYIFPKEDFTQSFVTKTNILTVISSIILASFFAIVYMNKKDFFIYIYNEPLERKAEDKGNIEREREIALYNNIIEYIEKNKPFKDPDFSTHLLAKALNSNVNYISKAIQAGGGGNFNLMLNNFRINYFKSMLNNETLKKFTIDYLYNEAGYKYRSTFNNAFKNVTGMTPSEYISQLTSNDNA